MSRKTETNHYGSYASNSKYDDAYVSGPGETNEISGVRVAYSYFVLLGWTNITIILSLSTDITL